MKRQRDQYKSNPGSVSVSAFFGFFTLIGIFSQQFRGMLCASTMAEYRIAPVLSCAFRRGRILPCHEGLA